MSVVSDDSQRNLDDVCDVVDIVTYLQLIEYEKKSNLNLQMILINCD